MKNLKLKIIKLLVNFALLTLIFNFALLTFNLSRASAQTARTFTVIPPSVQKTLDPGDKAEGKMKVINDSDEALTFTVTIQDYIVQDNIGTPTLLPPNTLNKRFSAASWFGVTPYAFTVRPHEKQVLDFYLQVPGDAAPGGHYAAAVFKPINPVLGVKGTGAAIQTQVGSLFYISVNGPIQEQSLVTRFFANSFQEYGPVKILTQIKNLGDLHVRPVGTITVSDILGLKSSQKLAEVNIFPTASRDYQNTAGQQIMIGRFKASLLASYGKNNNLPLVATVYFWVFPWKIALVAILIVIAVILGVKYWKKRKQTQSTTPKNSNEETNETQQS